MQPVVARTVADIFGFFGMTRYVCSAIARSLQWRNSALILSLEFETILLIYVLN